MEEFSLDKLKDIISSSEIPVVVMFRTGWCRMCDADELTINKFQINHDKEFVFCYVDVDKYALWRENKNSEFVIDKVPTYYIYYKKNLILRNNKPINDYELEEVLTKIKQ